MINHDKMCLLQAKQYIPSKPVRWGLKVWLRCDSVSGFCHQFEVYMGGARGQRQSIPLGQGVVERLTEKLVGKNVHVFLTASPHRSALLEFF